MAISHLGSLCGRNDLNALSAKVELFLLIFGTLSTKSQASSHKNNMNKEYIIGNI